MKKICIFVETWASGGIESFLYRMLRNMDRDDLEIELVVEELRNSLFTDPILALGIPITELSGNMHHVYQNAKLFRQFIRRRHFDVLHLNVYQGLSLLYAKIAWEEGIPVRIAHSHNTALRDSTGKTLKMLIHHLGRRSFSKYATELWACSKEASDFMFSSSSLSQNNYIFIPDGIETGRFHFDPCLRDRTRQALHLDHHFVIGNIGRLCSQKNQTFLLDILKALLPLRPDSFLLLVGDGPDEQALKEKASALQISDHVLFFGLSEEVESLLCAMDVFAFPSLFEGLGIVAIEAQASGLPVYCSENVPDEAKLSDYITTICLSNGAAYWAERLSRAVSLSDRSSAVKSIQEAGFDIISVAALIRQIYLQ